MNSIDMSLMLLSLLKLRFYSFVLPRISSDEISRKKTTIHSQPPRETQQTRPNLYRFRDSLLGKGRFSRQTSTNHNIFAPQARGGNHHPPHPKIAPIPARCYVTPMQTLSRLASFVLLAVLLAGCGTTVQTTFRSAPPLERAPRLGFKDADGITTLRTPEATAQALLRWAGRDSQRQAQAAQWILQFASSRPTARSDNEDGFLLTATSLALQSLRGSGVAPAQWLKDPRTQPTVETYNAALSRYVELNAKDLIHGAEVAVPSPMGDILLRVQFPKGFAPGDYSQLLLSDQIMITGFRTRIDVDGFGVALVGRRELDPHRPAEVALFPPAGLTTPLNALIRFDQKGAILELTNSKRVTTARIDGGIVPLSADFTAPLAFSFGGANDLLVGIRNFLNVAMGIEDAGIYVTEPYDPNRIPVLLIHGMSSSPIVWRNLANEAMRDPVLRQKFQFLYAYYSTGAPIPVSASMIKEDMELIRKTYGSRPGRDLDIVGYSMGGIIARILVTDIGTHLWDQIATVPFEQINFSPDDIPELRRNLFWTPLPDVRQVIFIATPHRGTSMADASYARFTNWLIRMPSDFVQFQRRFFDTLGDALKGTSLLRTRITGLDTLSANSPIFNALAEVPFEKGVKYYSIIGDRGRGDSPNSSDGIVGYWSSHLPTAQSELIVPTGHDAQAYPGAEQEIFRILQLGLK